MRGPALPPLSTASTQGAYMGLEGMGMAHTWWEHYIFDQSVPSP